MPPIGLVVKNNEMYRRIQLTQILFLFLFVLAFDYSYNSNAALIRILTVSFTWKLVSIDTFSMQKHFKNQLFMATYVVYSLCVYFVFTRKP